MKMLLTITYDGRDTQDLGYLLHKNPYKVQKYELNLGTAYVFYPEVSDTRTTAALLLDIDPTELSKGRLAAKNPGLFDYLNDRPYTSSSFLCTALNRVFGTAMSGRCDKMPELAQSQLCLTAHVYMLPCTDDSLPHDFFAPLGYSVTVEREQVSDAFPEWGKSPYIDLTISGSVRLSELLEHLYVLIPAFSRKHYYVDESEIDKMISHGGSWLSTHPARNKILYRSFMMKRDYAREALERLDEAAADTEDTGVPTDSNTAENEDSSTKHIPLNTRRYEAVRAAVLASGSASVIDLGCGEGRLTELLLREQQLKRVGAADISVSALDRAKKRFASLPEYQQSKLTLMHGSLTYTDKRFSGYDCAVCAEVIEHIDLSRLGAFEKVLFGTAAPAVVIITTPNRDYNDNYEFLSGGELRHSDHRFEWSRSEFLSWAERICSEYGYTAEISGIGDESEGLGMPSQMGVFTKCR